MLFWVTASLLTIGAILSVLLPIARRSPDREQPSSHDLEVYRDQLSELDRDAARGLIGAAEAEEARAEIARRILKIVGRGRAAFGAAQPGFRVGKGRGLCGRAVGAAGELGALWRARVAGHAVAAAGGAAGRRSGQPAGRPADRARRGASSAISR